MSQLLIDTATLAIGRAKFAAVAGHLLLSEVPGGDIATFAQAAQTYPAAFVQAIAEKLDLSTNAATWLLGVTGNLVYTHPAEAGADELVSLPIGDGVHFIAALAHQGDDASWDLTDCRADDWATHYEITVQALQRITGVRFDLGSLYTTAWLRDQIAKTPHRAYTHSFKAALIANFEIGLAGRHDN